MVLYPLQSVQRPQSSFSLWGNKSEKNVTHFIVVTCLLSLMKIKRLKNHKLSLSNDGVATVHMDAAVVVVPNEMKNVFCCCIG